MLVVNCVIGMYISLKLPYHSNISKQKDWGGVGVQGFRILGEGVL